MAKLTDFWRGQSTIKLMDGNLLACKDREKLLQSLIDSKANIDYTQGLDARFITDGIARLISQTKVDIIHFAFDSMKHETAILRGLKIFSKYFNRVNRNNHRVYILTNYDTTRNEDLYRVRKVIELGYQPFIMIYQKGSHDRFYTDLARWSNNSWLYRSCELGDYKLRTDGKTFKELYNI